MFDLAKGTEKTKLSKLLTADLQSAAGLQIQRERFGNDFFSNP